MQLTPCTITADLEVFTNPADLRRDIHTFMAYIRERTVKRAYRSNQIPKADVLRLCKILSLPDAVTEIDANGYSGWVEGISEICLELGLVKYDTKGIYAGYSSAEPSYPDNVIEYQADAYQAFLKCSLWEQEKQLCDTMCRKKNYQEIYHRHWFSRLHFFPTWGSAVGVMPLLDFVQTRYFLLELLTNLPSGQWYTTASLIAYLQQYYPYFLIPAAKDLPKKDQWNRPQALARYGNFYETVTRYGHTEDPVPDDAADGFLRVEGRFIERFLEGIPFTLGYVDVAYAPQDKDTPKLEMGAVVAFRLTDLFHRLMHNIPIIPTVTVLPTFEIHVESPIYPASLLESLQRCATPVSSDRVTILKLDKTRLKSTLAVDDNFQVLALLAEVTQHVLPRNVAVELAEWTKQSGAFILYTNLGLLESSTELEELVGGTAVSLSPLIVQPVSPTLGIIRQTQQALHILKQAEQIPVYIRHGESAFTPLPVTAQTIFPQQPLTPQSAVPRPKPDLKWQQETSIRLTTTAESYELFRTALVAQRCLFTADSHQYTITYSLRFQPQVDDAVQVLRQQYNLEIVTLDTATGK